MTKETYIRVTGMILGLVAVAHLVRFVLGWGVTIAAFHVPSWMSVVAFTAAGYLAYCAYKLRNS